MQGKPVWIIRRSEDTVSALADLDDDVRDPESEKEQQPAYAQNKHQQ